VKGDGMASDGRSEDFKTPTCRLLYAQSLFKPRAAEEGGKEFYQATLVFATTVDRSALNSAVKDAIIKKWGDQGLVRAEKGLIRNPFLKGDGPEAHNKKTGELNPGLGPDVFFIRVRSNFAPVIRWKSPNIPATEDEVYSGCFGFAALHAFAWSNSKNGDGVTFGIDYFQKTGEGEKLGGSGGVDPNKYYEKLENTGETPAEAKSGAGAGGFFG